MSGPPSARTAGVRLHRGPPPKLKLTFLCNASWRIQGRSTPRSRRHSRARARRHRPSRLRPQTLRLRDNRLLATNQKCRLCRARQRLVFATIPKNSTGSVDSTYKGEELPNGTKPCRSKRMVQLNFLFFPEWSQLGAPGPTILGAVYIDPSASVDKDAKIGPNVSIGESVQITAQSAQILTCVCN